MAASCVQHRHPDLTLTFIHTAGPHRALWPQTSNNAHGGVALGLLAVQRRQPLGLEQLVHLGARDSRDKLLREAVAHRLACSKCVLG